MSYDLSFWKYQSGLVLNHREVYEKLSDGQTVDGLEALQIDGLLQRVNELFSAKGWKQQGAKHWESNQGAFEIYTTSQFFRVSCYGLKGKVMNHFIDIASEFGCPLYDPQIGERFRSSRS